MAKSYASLDEAFWQRDPKHVARDLVGYTIGSLNSARTPLTYGNLIEVGAFSNGTRQSSIFESPPGTIATFSSYGTKVPVIAAHTKNGLGVITFRGAIMADGTYKKSSEITVELGIDQVEGELLWETDLFIAPSNLYLGLGWTLDDALPAKAADNQVANYKLVKP